MAEKKNGRFIAIFHILRQYNLTLWARKLEKFFTYPLQIGYAYY